MQSLAIGLINLGVALFYGYRLPLLKDRREKAPMIRANERGQAQR